VGTAAAYDSISWLSFRIVNKNRGANFQGAGVTFVGAGD